MKAVVFERAGRAEEVLRVRELPSPAPGPDEVLIEVTLRPIQPADFLFIAGQYRQTPRLPQPAGLEGVGIVRALGAKVMNLAIGQRVAFRATGTWAAEAVASATRVYSVPHDIPDQLAAQFSLNALTAYGLVEQCMPKAGAQLLVTAGRSSVAKLVGALSVVRGQYPHFLVRSPRGHQLLDPSGGIVREGENLAATLGDLSNSSYDSVLDPIGGPQTIALMDALKPGGRLVSYGLLDDREMSLRASRILFKNLVWQGFGIDGWLNKLSPGSLEKVLGETWALVRSHPDLLPVTNKFALADISSAINMARISGGAGKVMLST